jgi:hypothetical protein
MADPGTYLELTLVTTGVVRIRVAPDSDPVRVLEDFTRGAGQFTGEWLRVDDPDGEMVARDHVVSATVRRIE